MKKLLTFLLLSLPVIADAQFTPGQLLTAAELNSQLALKTTNSSAAITGGTISGISSLAGITSTTGMTFTPLTPFNEFLNPGDSNHFTDFLINQSNIGNHSTYDNAAFAISSSPFGSGQNGPQTADEGLFVSNIKKNWQTSSQLGEIDGIYVVTRQGSDDTSGLLINSANIAGFANAIEAVVSTMNPSATPIAQMDVQMGEIQTGLTGTAGSAGFVATSNVGTLGSGLLIQSGASGGWTNAITVGGNNNGGVTYTVSPNGVVNSTQENIVSSATSGQTITVSAASNSAVGASIQITGNGATTPKKFLRVFNGNLQVINSAGSAPLFTWSDSGDLVTNGLDTTPIGALNPSTGAFTTITASGAITPNQTNGIVGTTTNNNANAGSVGEYVTATAAINTVSLTTATTTNIISISLTAGDWDVSGVLQTSSSAQVATNIFGGISTTSATLGALGTYSQIATGTTGNLNAVVMAVPTTRLSLSGTTTVYLVGSATFASGTASGGGVIRARRIR